MSRNLNISASRLAEIKKKYPEGARVRLVRMNDRFAPPAGTEGTVMHVDDIGSIHVQWDNGSTLAVLIDEDKCVIV